MREHFDPARLVKTQPAPGKPVIDVLKMNVHRQTRAGVYEYDQLLINSYMDDTGFAQVDVDTSDGTLFRDELMLWLRAGLLDLRPGRRLRVAASFFSGRSAYAVEDAAIVEVEDVRADMVGQQVAARRVVLDRGGRRETFVFQRDDLRVMLSWSDDGGNRYTLRKTLFLDYWKRNRPGDEALLR